MGVVSVHPYVAREVRVALGEGEFFEGTFWWKSLFADFFDANDLRVVIGRAGEDVNGGGAGLSGKVDALAFLEVQDEGLGAGGKEEGGGGCQGVTHRSGWDALPALGDAHGDWPFVW